MAGKYLSYPDHQRLDSGLVIPSHWVSTMLKRVVDQSRPVTYGIVQAGPNVSDGIPYIRPADMTDEAGVKVYENLLRTSCEIAANYERSTIQQGDIVCSIGPSFGKLMITPKTLEGANLTQGTARIAISAEYSSRYFFWQLRSNESFQQWESSVGGATFRALNLGPLAETKIVVPSTEEQIQIANFLDHETAKIDILIAKQQQLIKLLKEKRQAVISHAVTKGLNPDAPMRDSGVDWLGDVPKHWVTPKIGYLCDVTKLTGFEYTNYWQPSDDGEIVALRGFNVSERFLSLEKTEKISTQLSNRLSRSKLKAGDIVMPCTGTLGNAAVIEHDDKFHINQNIAKLSFSERVTPNFAVQWLTSSVFRTIVDFNNTSGMQPVLLIGDIRNMPIPLPPHREQEKIIEYLNISNAKYEQMIQRAEQSLNLLGERRIAIISAAVTGKIDVRNWKPE